VSNDRSGRCGNDVGDASEDRLRMCNIPKKSEFDAAVNSAYGFTHLFCGTVSG
jgi:hypothetical protein